MTSVEGCVIIKFNLHFCLFILATLLAHKTVKIRMAFIVLHGPFSTCFTRPVLDYDRFTKCDWASEKGPSWHRVYCITKS